MLSFFNKGVVLHFVNVPHLDDNRAGQVCVCVCVRLCHLMVMASSGPALCPGTDLLLRGKAEFLGSPDSKGL